MFFFSRHKTTSRSPFILGANQESWGCIEPIQTIRREDRDHRLATYTTLAEEAYNAVRETEDAVELPDGLYGKPRQIQLSETRMLAIDICERIQHFSEDRGKLARPSKNRRLGYSPFCFYLNS